jgi:hypothetical protein
MGGWASRAIMSKRMRATHMGDRRERVWAPFLCAPLLMRTPSYAAPFLCGPLLMRTPLQVVAILAAGGQLPFEVTSVKLDLPELQACVCVC